MHDNYERTCRTISSDSSKLPESVPLPFETPQKNFKKIKNKIFINYVIFENVFN